MTTVHIPGLARWCCAICDAPTDQRHHLAYGQRLPERWQMVPLCLEHHRRLDRLYDGLEHRIPLAVVSAQFIASPAYAEAMAWPVGRQLSFGDQATPQGEHWRDTEATSRRLADKWESMSHRNVA